MQFRMCVYVNRFSEQICNWITFAGMDYTRCPKMEDEILEDTYKLCFHVDRLQKMNHKTKKTKDNLWK